MSEQELITRHTALSNNIIAFCRFLRTQDFFIGLTEQTETLRILAILNPFEDPDLFQQALKSILVKNRRQYLLFDELYSKYWRELDKALDSKIKDVKEEKSRPVSRDKAFHALKDWLQGNTSGKKEAEEEQEKFEIATYSEAEVLAKTDFSAFSDDQIPDLLDFLRKLAKKLSRDLSRRYQTGNRSRKLDLRQILRKNMRRGGEIIELTYRQPQKNKIKLVLLCDVSRSMELYSRFFIHFMYSLQSVFHSMETFVFGTRLTRITTAMQSSNFEKALMQLQEEVPDWFGGTRIGESLEQFCEAYSNKMINRNTIVLIMSDGWDTGGIEALEESMRSLHQKAGKIIWLNPLAGNQNYQPSVRAMEIAMPYIDVHLAAHNLDSLKALIKYL